MTMKFSAATGGFYLSGLHSDIPADAVSITSEQHQNLMTAQMNGQRIMADDNGFPVAVDVPFDPEVAIASMRARRDDLLRACDHSQMADYPISASQRQAWADYRQQLRDLPETITDPADIDWPIEPESTPHE